MTYKDFDNGFLKGMVCGRLQVLEDKELELILCDCDRFQMVHLEDCEFIRIKDRILDNK